MQNDAFSGDKRLFFTKQYSSLNRSNAVNDIDIQVQGISYDFLLKHQASLETELADMFAVIKKKRR